VTNDSVPSSGRTRIVSVSASSKKAGKSTVASHLVRELGADYGLKVSCGGSHAEQPLTSDPDVISRPGTDTGALFAAGAGLVLWVSAPASKLAAELDRALSMFPAGGILVVEGNSALDYVRPDFAVFLVNVPFEDFKASAFSAMEKADLILLNRAGKLATFDAAQLERSIRERAPDADVIQHDDRPESLAFALAEAVRLARIHL
jgi:molybdopterin-guanine dinucleotide biosynthesis protein